MWFHLHGGDKLLAFLSLQALSWVCCKSKRSLQLCQPTHFSLPSFIPIVFILVPAIFVHVYHHNPLPWSCFPSLLSPGTDMMGKLLKMQMLEDEDDLAYETEKKRRTASSSDAQPAWMRTLHSTACNWLQLIPLSVSPLKRTVENIKVGSGIQLSLHIVPIRSECSRGLSMDIINQQRLIFVKHTFTAPYFLLPTWHR